MRDALLYIGLAQTLFAAVLVFTKRHKQIADKILISWLAMIAFKFLVLIFYNEHSEYFDADFSSGYIPLTFGPFLYLYTRHLTDDEAKFRVQDILHSVPFFLMTAFYFAFFKDRLSFADYKYLKHDEYLSVRILYATVYIISIFIYTILTYRLLFRFKLATYNNFSFTGEKNQLRWLYFVAGLFTLTFAVYFVVGLINAISEKQILDSGLLTDIGLTIMAFSISYFGIKQPNLFRPSDVMVMQQVDDTSADIHSEKKIQVETVKNTPSIEQKTQNITPEAAGQIRKLLEYMEREKPYLNAELTIQDLSEKLNIPKTALTSILNTNLDKNFFTFINEYRIESVKKKLLNPEYNHLTLLAIAYDSGFNSKSSFNNLFKQYTGYTPSEYKKLHSEQSK
jgi:AraC-like DNA-binding protein